MITFDPLGILGVLAQHEVRFVVIGGFAGNLRGTPDVTQDLDICYARDDDNLRRLASALADLEARLRVAREPDADLPFQLDVQALRLGDSFTFTTRLGDLDVLGTPSGTNGFDDLDRGASHLDAADMTVGVASIDDLIRMKRASARRKDVVQLEHLEALREEIDRFHGEGLDPQQGSP